MDNLSLELPIEPQEAVALGARVPPLLRQLEAWAASRQEAFEIELALAAAAAATAISSGGKRAVGFSAD